MPRFYLVLLCVAAAALAASGADSADFPDFLKARENGEAQAEEAALPSQDDKFHFQPMGRMLMDAAAYFGDKHVQAPADADFADGVALPDLRLGVLASYRAWSVRLEMGYAYEKLLVRDCWFEYRFNPHQNIRLGYFIIPFGLNMVTSSSMKPCMEEPMSNTFFNCNPYGLGVRYLNGGDQTWFAAASLTVEEAAVKKRANAMGRQAWGVNGRALWCPRRAPGDIVQAGLSAGYTRPPYNDDPALSHQAFTFSANFPSRVSRVTAVQALVTGARGEVKLSPELLLSRGRWALESQYYWMAVSRRGLPAYHAQGAFGVLRCLLRGDRAYSRAGGVAGLATPRHGTLELVAGYDYINASSARAGIAGGISQDCSLTLNYYFNPLIIARLRTSYTTVSHRQGLPPRDIFTLQGRLQIVF